MSEVGATPTSVGALLAEEWTIDPFSALLSFLEMIWIEEVDKSMYQTARIGLDQLQEAAGRRISQPENDIDFNPQMDLGGSACSRVTRTWYQIQSVLGKYQRQFAISIKSLLGQYKTEILALIIYALERESILRTNATIAEAMYGGHRVEAVLSNVANGNDKTKVSKSKARAVQLRPLRAASVTRLALLKAFVPYLRRKLDTAFGDSHRQRPNDYGQPNTTRLRKVCLFLYPYLRATAQGLNLLCQWRFLSGQSFHFDLISAFLGQVVRRVTLQDHDSNGTSGTVTYPSVGEKSSAPDKVPSTNDDKAKAGSSNTLMKSTFVQKFIVSGTVVAILLSWTAWVKAERKRLLNEEQIKFASHLGRIPPPPPPPPTPLEYMASTSQSDECPLCRQSPRQAPTATNSGYVFCWSCIQRHVGKSQTCPITGKACTESQLVRLFEPRLMDGSRES